MEVLLDTCRCPRARYLLLIYMFLLKAAADCPKPEGSTTTVLTNEALLLNAFPEGTKVSFECANGNVKDKGSEFITCTDGKWSELDLTCKRKDCGQPEPKPNMSFNIIAGTLFGDRIRAICDKGYEIRGPSYMTCYNSGWSRKPRCEMVTCEKPTEVINGSCSWISKDDPQYGEIINFSCNEGCILVGKSSIVCSETGEYDSPPPKCEVVTCEKPTEVINGRSSWNSEDDPQYGEIINFSCNEGYTLVGKSSIVCSETGEYDSPPPKCEGATTEDIFTTTMVTHSTPATPLQDKLEEALDINTDIGNKLVIVCAIWSLSVSCVIVAFLLGVLLIRKGGSSANENLPL